MTPAAATPAPAGAEGADGGPRLYGVVDVLRPDRVAGWAIDRSDSAAAVEIEVLREGRRVGVVRADRARPDLARGGVGTGRYGFACALEPPVEPGFEFTVEVRARAADGAVAALKRTGAPADPDRRLLERLFAEVRALRAAPPAAAAPPEALTELAGRLELAQLRLEAALGAVGPAQAPRLDGLRWLVAAALALGAGSFGFGLWSMWG